MRVVIVDTMLWLLRQKHIPRLAVHGSLIVPQQHEELAAKILRAVYRGHLKVTHLIKINRPAAP
jgi:hypothetical protein